MEIFGMKSKPSVSTFKLSLRALVNRYKKRAKEIETYLSNRPNEWGKFQNEFNAEVNKVFREIMEFEKENIAAGQEDKVYKLKRIFINRIKSIFTRGEYGEWS